MSPEKEARVVSYSRVSTAEQGENGASLAGQRHALEAECKRRGWTLEAAYEDVASGKTTEKRPGLAAALAHLEEPEGPSAIVVVKLDRLTRSVVDGGQLFARAAKGGWDVVALDFGLDTSTAAGRLVANVMMSVGQWEREVNSERTKAGMAQKKREGIRFGRPRWNQQTTRPEEAERARIALARLRELRAKGATYRTIAATLNDEGIVGIQGGSWTHHSCRLALKRYGLADEEQAA